MLTFTLKVGETKTVDAVPADAQGKPEPLPLGSPVPQWGPHGSVVSLQPAADGLSCQVTGLSPGVVLVGVVDGTITGQAEVTVEPGLPTQFVLSLAP